MSTETLQPGRTQYSYFKLQPTPGSVLWLLYSDSVSRLDGSIVPRVSVCPWLCAHTYMKLTQPVPAGGAIQTKLRLVVGRWLTWDATTLHMNWFPNWWSDIIPGRKRQRKETVTSVNGSLQGANRPRNVSAMCFIMATRNEKTPGVCHQITRINANENTGAGLCLSQGWLCIYCKAPCIFCY